METLLQATVLFVKGKFSLAIVELTGSAHTAENLLCIGRRLINFLITRERELVRELLDIIFSIKRILYSSKRRFLRLKSIIGATSVFVKIECANQ